MLSLSENEAEDTMKKVTSEKFKIIDDFHFANLLSTTDPLAVKYLGSKSVNSLKLTELSRKIETKIGKG